jgi:type I restriction enzyme S subunit
MSVDLKLEQQEDDLPPRWNRVSIGEICDLGGGITPSKSNDDYWSGSIPWASPKDFEGVSLDQTEDNLTEYAVSENSINLYNPGDIAMVVRSGVLYHSLPVAQLSTEMAVNQDIKILKPAPERVDSDYLLNILLYEADRIRASCVKTGTTVESVETAFLEAYKLPLPLIPEQRRIADILSTVDEQIQQTDEIIKTTIELKRGLMQDFFRPSVQNGRSTKLGDVPAAWEIGQIREFDVSFISGGTPSRENPEYYGGEIPWLKTSEVQNRRVWSSEEFITKQGLEKSSAAIVPPGSVLVAMYGGGTVGNVGLLETEAATNQACCAINTESSVLNNEFLYYQLLFEHRRLVSYAAGSSQQNLSKHDVEQFDVLVPPEAEQRRIAENLSETNKKLRQEREHKQHLMELKRGLMQDLLTGKVRVNID